MAKIGNTLFRCNLSVGYFVIYPCLGTVDVRITDVRGQQITELEAGTPFHAEVVITDENVDQPTLEQKDSQVQVLGQTMRSAISMGHGRTHTRKRFIYTLRADKTGMVHIGPFVIGTERTTPIPMPVRAPHITPAPSVSGGQDNVVRLTASTERPVVGQLVTLTVRFYSTVPRAFYEHLPPLHLEGARTGSWQKPHQFSQQLNGRSYAVVEWRLELIPENPGELLIPRIAVTEAENRTSLWGAAFSGLYPGREHYTNALALHVAPLPATDRSIQGVGRVDRCALHAEKKEVQEAAVVTLHIEGDTAVAYFEAPVVTVPPGLSIYNSQVTEERSEHGVHKKFEYVVMAAQPGSYEIPAQNITYFDPERRVYSTCTTKPLTLAFQRAAPQMPAAKDHEQPAAPLNEAHVMPPENPRFAWCSAHLPEHEQPGAPFVIPERFVMMLIGVPTLLLMAMPFIEQVIRYYRIRRGRFVRARATLATLRAAHDMPGLARLMRDLSQDSGLFTLPAEQQHAWGVFYEKVERYAYAPGKQDDKEKLFSEALLWINRLERYART